MKKLASTILVCLLLVGSIFALTSCFNNPYGTSESAGYQSATTTGGVYEFGLTDVTYTYYVAGVEAYSVEGTYKIAANEEGAIRITFTYGEERGGAKSGSFHYAKGGDVISISSIKYTKVK